MSNKINDDRFSHITHDPRFRKMKKEHRKVKIDKRFEGMFKDTKFKLKYTVDKRGRPIKSSSDTHLKRFYELSDDGSDKESNEKGDCDHGEDDADEDNESLTQLKEKKTISNKKLLKPSENESPPVGDRGSDEDEDSDGDEENEESENEEIDPAVDRALVKDSSSSEDESSEDESNEDESNDEKAGTVDRARGIGGSESSSSEDESSDEKEDADDFDHKWGELADDAIVVEDATYRLAVCNMDWDRIKAKDIMVLFNSFKPANGVIKSVNIYASEYGKKRMAEEAVKGPQELTSNKFKSSKDQSEEGNEYHREKLRTYQLNRLKYYYAVVVCDSKETANTIYEQCDGIEYETSSTKLDLRFIPDDMELDEESHSTASELPDFSTYKPSLFVNTALNQSKVELTWDETDRDRTAVMMRKFSKEDIETMDVKDYLASSGSEDEIDYYAGFEDPDFGTNTPDEESIENNIVKYKDILSNIKNDKEKKDADDVEMEITWEPGLKETTEEMVKKKQDKNSLTPWEQYLENKKEKKKKKLNEKKLEKKEESEETAQISDEEIPNSIDINDSYFQEELSKNDSISKPEKKKKNVEKDPSAQLEEGEMALLTFDKDETKNHFSLKGIQDNEKMSKKKKKRKKKNLREPVQDDFQMNVKDPRFADVFKNPQFNIDPSAKEYKKTKGIEAIINEKIKQKENDFSNVNSDFSTLEETSSPAKKLKSDGNVNLDPSLLSLVKSIKAKSSVLNKKKLR